MVEFFTVAADVEVRGPRCGFRFVLSGRQQAVIAGWFGDVGKCLAILYVRPLGCRCPASRCSNVVFVSGLLVFCCQSLANNTANYLL